LALARTPVEADRLSEAAKKVLGGQGPLKMMAARGLAPLPRPADLATVIYQLSLDSDASVAAAATKTAGELPEKILGGALTDAALDARVLDFYAGKVLSKPALLEAILLNASTADETVRELAGQVGEREVDIIATNEQRLLRHPAIIGALYMNTKARMSTVDRAVELAVRNRVTVPEIPAWEEIVAAILGTKTATGALRLADVDVDTMFAQVAQVAIGETTQAQVLAEAENAADELIKEAAPQTDADRDKKKVQIDKLPIPAKIRLATLGNAFARAILIRDSNKQVAMAAIRSPGMTDNEVVKFSANRSLGDDVIRVISNTKEWTKLYQVKLNLINNPKTPLATSMRMLPLLQNKDLRNVARSKGIPSALSQQAKKLSSARQSGGD
jgi:hypothetical protein